MYKARFRPNEAFVATAYGEGTGSQKFSTIHTLLWIVGAGMARYLPLREGIAQLGMALLTSNSLCALPARSTYRRADERPVGLLVIDSPCESAAQSTEVNRFQSLTAISRESHR